MMAVDIKLGPVFEAGTRHALFRTGVTSVMDGRNHFAVTGDGQRFLISSPAKGEAASWINVVTNWPALFKKGR